MKFRTTCPHCESVLRLTAEQLEAAQGWAQCGVCATAFDMRLSLAAENGDPLPLESAPPPAADETPEPPLSGAGVENGPEDAVQPDLTANPASQPAVAPPDAPTAPPLAGIENRAASPDLPSIILIDPDADVPDDYGPVPVFQATPHVEGGTNENNAASVYGPAYTPPPAASKPAKQMVSADVRPQQPIADGRSQSNPARSFRVFWTIASLILLLGLMLQLTYFLRDTLASKVPATRPWLEAACATLGCSLSLPKDAALIQIIGSDLQAESAGPGHLQLKLTLGNRAPYAQAWPVIVLTLTDQKDQPQARRSFAPSEYLSDQKLLASGIPALSEHPLTLPLEVRNMPMAGYRLEITY